MHHREKILLAAAASAKRLQVEMAQLLEQKELFNAELHRPS